MASLGPFWQAGSTSGWRCAFLMRVVADSQFHPSHTQPSWILDFAFLWTLAGRVCHRMVSLLCIGKLNLIKTTVDPHP